MGPPADTETAVQPLFRVVDLNSLVCFGPLTRIVAWDQGTVVWFKPQGA